MHFVEYLKRPNMIIGFVEFFNFSLSYKKSNHLWDKKNFNFNVYHYIEKTLPFKKIG